jgi:transposase
VPSIKVSKEGCKKIAYKKCDMKYRFFIGIDVSKLTFDVAVLGSDKSQVITHQSFSNDVKGIKGMTDFLRKTFSGYSQEEALFCMEATGIYCNALLNFFKDSSASVWVENSVQIKRSSGIARGKQDKIDAQRIALYAYRNADAAKLWKPARAVLEQIRNLTSLRDRMVQAQKKLQSPIDEFEAVGEIKMAKLLSKSISKSLRAIDADIKNIELQITSLMKQDESLNHLFKLVTSVVGIGFVTATNLIIHTNEFTTMNNSRKLACYCGVAPFPHQSGTSIRGKTRVSHMANKKLKTNLHMAALTAIKFDSELKGYYERKVAEGKHKLSVLNAVKSKLLARVVSVVNNNQEYVRKVA